MTTVLIVLYILSIIKISTGYLQFSSSSSRVTVSDISKINAIGTGSFSISLFLQSQEGTSYSVPSALLSTRKEVAYKAFMVALVGDWDIYTGYRPFIQLRYNHISYSSSQTYTDGNWQHLVITRSNIPSQDKCELNYYINATNIYSTTWEIAGGCSSSIASDGSLFFGYDVGTTGWIGNLAHISFWKKALNVHEIHAIYNHEMQFNQSSTSTCNLLHYYPLNEDASVCGGEGIVYDVWNHHNGVLSSSTDPICVHEPAAGSIDSIQVQTMPGETTCADENTGSGWTVGAIVGGVCVMLFIIIGAMICYCYSKKKAIIDNNNLDEKDEYPTNNIIATAAAPMDESPPPYVAADDHNIELHTTKGAEFAYSNVAPTAPIHNETEATEPGRMINNNNDTNNVDGECDDMDEGAITEYCDIEQWFNDDIDLQDLSENDKNSYFNVLVQNGFDKISIIKKVSNNDLIEIGINKLGHRKLILSAVAKL